MIALALEALAASTVLMALVLAVRGPARRAFGAELAYALWVLPVLRLLLPPLPSDWNPYVAAPLAGVGERAMVLIAPTGPVDSATAVPVAASSQAATWLTMLWGAGAVAILLWQSLHYLLFRARVLRDAQPVAQVGSVAVVESAAATGPLAFGLLRRVVAFPRDFAERYDAQERELALAHELGHHRRGDLWANWIALALLALQWFNPVAWIAFRAFRADQEMANDAGVLARAGANVRHAYGCAIVKAAHGRALTPACHLNTVNDLKGRLRMLARGRVSGGRVAAGAAAVAVLGAAGLVLTASGMPAAARVRAGVERVTGIRLDTIDHDVAAALAPVARTHTTSKVTIIEHGRTIVLHDDKAAAYIAAHPVATPPVPPVPPSPSIPYTASQPPVPPTPPAPPVLPATPIASVGSVVGGNQACDGRTAVISSTRDGRQMMICAGASDRAARGASREAMQATREASREAMQASREASRDAMRASRDAMRSGREAMRSALASLAAARSSLAKSPHLTSDARADALAGIDEAMAEVKEEMASAD
jgi:beta-lactamase regulating signal transducer with metallopeptidase domain